MFSITYEITPLKLVNISLTAKAAALQQSMQQVNTVLARHAARDWGNISGEDKAVYDAALKSDSTILSEFVTSEFDRIWVGVSFDNNYLNLSASSLISLRFRIKAAFSMITKDAGFDSSRASGIILDMQHLYSL